MPQTLPWEWHHIDPAFFSVSAGEVTFSELFTWVIVNSLTVQMSPNVAYINNYAGQMTFILPVSCPVGSIMRIAGGINNLSGGSSWTVQQNDGQSIWIAGAQSTIGITGGLTAGVSGDCVQILCIVEDTVFQAIDNAFFLSVF